MNRGYLWYSCFENPKTFYVSNCNSTKKSFWNAHLEMPLFLNMPPKAAFLQKEVLPKDFKNFFQQLSHPFQGLPTKIMITGSIIIIRIMIEDTVFISQALLSSIVVKHCCQASSSSIVVKHRCQASSSSLYAKVVNKTTKIIHIQKWVTYRFLSYLMFPKY
jgi:hypothetical protein